MPVDNKLLIGIVIVVAIIVVLYYMSSKPKHTTKRKCEKPSTQEGTQTTEDKSAEGFAEPSGLGSPENRFMEENLQMAKNDDRGKKEMSPEAWDTYMKTAALEDKVYENHESYLCNNRVNGTLFTGKPFVADSFDYMPDDWKGLRLPRKVPVDPNAQLQQDVDTTNYAVQSTIGVNSAWGTYNDA